MDPRWTKDATLLRDAIRRARGHRLNLQGTQPAAHGRQQIIQSFGPVNKSDEAVGNGQCARTPHPIFQTRRIRLMRACTRDVLHGRHPVALVKRRIGDHMVKTVGLQPQRGERAGNIARNKPCTFSKSVRYRIVPRQPAQIGIYLNPNKLGFRQTSQNAKTHNACSGSQIAN